MIPAVGRAATVDLISIGELVDYGHGQPHSSVDDPIYVGTPIILKGIFMDWIIIVLAGLFETGWAIGLKYTDGFTRLWPTVGTVFSMVISLALLGIAMKSIPVGTAYAVWVGIGAVGTAMLGIVLLGEPVNSGRILSLALIIAGIVGLKLTTQS